VSRFVRLPGFIQRYPNAIALLVTALFLGLIPFFSANDYVLTVMVIVAEFTMLTVGLSLLMGYTGQISLGQATFFGVGAYTTGILATHFGLSILPAIAAGVVVALLLALLIGLFIFRLHGHYLAMATLGLNVILYLVLTQEVEWTGGPSGLRGIPEASIGAFTFQQDIHYYWLVWAATLAIMAISLNIVNSRVGRAMRAVHSSEVAASALGVDAGRLKAQVFALSAAYGALAGGLHAAYLGFISPSSFSVVISIEVVVMAVVGGLASVWGALFGAAAILAIQQNMDAFIEMLVPNASGEHEIIAFGLILMLIMILSPQGLFVGLATAVRQRLAGSRRRETSREEATPLEPAVSERPAVGERPLGESPP